MNKSKNSVRRLTIFALFCAIEILLYVTPFGYLRLGFISATLLHIPVIVLACTMGIKEGALLGLVFGITSVINATLQPGVTSFCFSPFVEVGGIGGNFYSLIIAIVPRVLLGIVSGWLYNIMSKHTQNNTLCAGVSAAIATMIHTILVLGMICIFFGPEYSNAIGVAQSALLSMMGVVVLTNSIPEIILASLVNIALSKALKNQFNKA